MKVISQRMEECIKYVQDLLEHRDLASYYNFNDFEQIYQVFHGTISNTYSLSIFIVDSLISYNNAKLAV